MKHKIHLLIMKCMLVLECWVSDIVWIEVLVPVSLLFGGLVLDTSICSILFAIVSWLSWQFLVLVI